MKNKISVVPTRTPVRVPKAAAAEPENETPNVTEIDLEFEIDPQKTYIFETIQKSPNPRFQNLGSNTLALDPVEKRYVELRYFPTAKSIFADEQDDSCNEQPAPPLGFWFNQISCIGEDIRKMEYLFNHPLYEHSPYRVHNKPAMYTLADKEVQEGIKAKRLAVELKALGIIAKQSIGDLQPISRIIFGVTETSEIAIRNALSELVKKPKQGSDRQSNAEKLLDNLSDLDLQRTYHIQNAIDRGVISADVNTMRVSFVEGNVFIFNLTYKKDPVRQITDWSFTENGEKWYSMLRQKI